MKTADIALPTATTDSSSIILTSLGDSSHGQSQEPLEYAPLELDAHLREVYEEHILVDPRESDLQALDIIDVQWDLEGGSGHNLWWEKCM